MSETIVGGGRLSVRWSGPPGNFFPRSELCLLKLFKALGVTVLSLSGEIASGSAEMGLFVMNGGTSAEAEPC